MRVAKRSAAIALYANLCADCHGADATEIIFDGGEQSLGQHARYFGYAVAMITLAGEPGSEMGPQDWGELEPEAQTQNLLDLLAALCDRERYPRGAGTDPEVPDGGPALPGVSALVSPGSVGWLAQSGECAPPLPGALP